MDESKFAIKKKFDKIITIFKYPLDRGYTTNDDFFSYADFALENYYNKTNFLANWTYKTREVIDPKTNKPSKKYVLNAGKRIEFLRSLAILLYAQHNGIVYVNWSELLKMDIKKAASITFEAYTKIRDFYPAIAKQWDEDYAKIYGKDNSYEKN